MKGVGIIEMTMCPITQITSYTNSLDKFYKSLFFTVEHCLDRLFLLLAEWKCSSFVIFTQQYSLCPSLSFPTTDHLGNVLLYIEHQV